MKHSEEGWEEHYEEGWEEHSEEGWEVAETSDLQAIFKLVAEVNEQHLLDYSDSPAMLQHFLCLDRYLG